MKTRLTYSTLLILLLVLIAGYIFHGALVLSIGQEQADSLLGGGMPSNLMTPKPNPTSDFDELLGLIEQTIDPDDWISIGGSKHIVKTDDLVEVEESDGEYALNMRLCWRDQVLAAQHRYFISYQGRDGEIEDRPRSFLACAMYSNGFLSGSCECNNVSSTEVAVSPDWTFDDRDTNVESTFNRSFNATLGGTGVIDCGNDATLIWRFVKKATE